MDGVLYEQGVQPFDGLVVVVGGGGDEDRPQLGP
jgi:hypothetical protein